MNIEEVKERRKGGFIGPITAEQLIDWLIAEVDKLTDMLHETGYEREMLKEERDKYLKTYKPYYDAVDNALIVSHIGVASGNVKADLNEILAYEYELGKYFTATRCIELIEQSETPEESCEAIREEFNL